VPVPAYPSTRWPHCEARSGDVPTKTLLLPASNAKATVLGFLGLEKELVEAAANFMLDK
jgi:hypothetical protein